MAYLTLGYDHRVIDGSGRRPLHVPREAGSSRAGIRNAVVTTPGAAAGAARSKSGAGGGSVRRGAGTCSATSSRRARPVTLDDLLILVEHPDVLTLGVKGDGGRSHTSSRPPTR